jgi:hypothetical protein
MLVCVTTLCGRGWSERHGCSSVCGFQCIKVGRAVKISLCLAELPQKMGKLVEVVRELEARIAIRRKDMYAHTQHVFNPLAEYLYFPSQN